MTEYGTHESNWTVHLLNGGTVYITGLYVSDLELGAVRFFDSDGLIAEYNFGAVEGVVRDTEEEV